MDKKNTKRILQENFCIERYGIICRFVQESDAEFILNLRHNNRLNKYVHSVGTIEDQIRWTREYKKREREGLDYYFIFSKDDTPIGLSRIYNIDWVHHTYTGGSWINVPGFEFDVSMIPSLIIDDIREALGLLVCIYDVRKDNKQVLRYHRKIMCAYEYGETNRDVLFLSTPETRANNKLRKFLGFPSPGNSIAIPYVEEEIDY